jgi:phosphoribosylformylglycinamidine cyclo-ligase
MSASPTQQFDHVNYDVLDKAKAAFIEASKKTLNFAGSFGQVAQSSLGASANIYSLNLEPFIKQGLTSMQVALVPEGLGTADDARPEDLSESELEEFWFNIGIKSIAVMTNDAATAGIQTVLVGMYLPSAAPEVVFTDAFMKGFLSGYVQGCKEVGCVYISGETPQLKNKLYPDKLDIAGALFGVVPAGSQAISPNNLSAGDYIVLVESSGPHENGFTTLRGLAPKLSNGYRTKLSDGQEYWKAINKGSKLYTGLIQQVLRQGIFLSNAENITGHGWQKIMRSSKPFTYVIDQYPQILPVFEFVKDAAQMSYHDLLSVFNSGSGLALFVRTQEDAKKVVSIANKNNLKAVVAGQVENSKDQKSRKVIVPKLSVTLEGDGFILAK